MGFNLIKPLATPLKPCQLVDFVFSLRMEETEDGRGLRDRLEMAEQNATKAAELGKMLLEQNDELNEKLDEQRKQYDKRLEVRALYHRFR